MGSGGNNYYLIIIPSTLLSKVFSTHLAITSVLRPKLAVTAVPLPDGE